MNTKTIVIIVLGILLFLAVSFIVTTRMSSPTAMELMLPKSESEETASFVKASGAITMILIGGDKIYYYDGDSVNQGKVIDFAEFRPILLDKKKNTDAKDLVVVIKPADNSTYKNAVDALDEMAINDIKRYAMVEISEKEKLIIDALKK